MQQINIDICIVSNRAASCHVIDRAYVRRSVQTLGEGDGRLRKSRECSFEASLRRRWENFLGGKLLCSPRLFHFKYENKFLLLVTNNERAGTSTREETTKFDKFKGREPLEKPRKEKKRTFQWRTP